MALVQKILDSALVPTQRTKEWYTARHDLVTASQVSTILGRGMGTLASVFRDKVTRSDATKIVSPSMQAGIDFEPYLRQAFERKHGIVIRECGLYNRSFIGASPDGVEESTCALLELKVSTKRFLWEKMPQHYYDQCQCQLYAIPNAPFLFYFEACIDEITSEGLWDEWRVFEHSGRTYAITDYREHKILRDMEWEKMAIPLLRQFHVDVMKGRKFLGKTRKRPRGDLVTRFLSLPENSELRRRYESVLWLSTERLSHIGSGESASLLSVYGRGKLTQWQHHRRIQLYQTLGKELAELGDKINMKDLHFYRFGSPVPHNTTITLKLAQDSGVDVLVGGSFVTNSKVIAGPWLLVRANVLCNISGMEGIAVQTNDRAWVIVHISGSTVHLTCAGNIGGNYWSRRFKTHIGLMKSVLKENGLTVSDKVLVLAPMIAKAQKPRKVNRMIVEVDDVELDPIVAEYKRVTSDFTLKWHLPGWKRAQQDSEDLRKDVIKYGHISLLPMIQEKDLQLLYKAGIETLVDARNLDWAKILPGNSRVPKWKAFVKFHTGRSTESLAVYNEAYIKIKDGVKALRKTLHADSKGTRVVYVDIETLPADLHSGDSPWTFLIGVLSFTNSGKRCFRPSLLRQKNKRGIRKLLSMFFRTLGQQWKRGVQKVKIFHWGHIDKTTIARMCMEFPKFKPEFDRYIWIDICRVLQKRRVLIRGSYTYKLKDASRALCKGSYDDLDVTNGSDAMFEAWDLYRTGAVDMKHPVLAHLLDYNQMDCEMLHRIRNRLLGKGH